MGDHDKKKRRLERNRESARECRARKKANLLNLHQQLAKLETDNMHLRLQLKATPGSGDAEGSAEMEHSSGLSLEEMINQGASEKEIQAAIKQLQERHSDYGRDRRSAFSFHLSQLRRCLLPTQTTRIMLFLMKCAVQYLSPEGKIKYTAPASASASSSSPSSAGPSSSSVTAAANSDAQSAEIVELLASLLAVIKPTREQRKQLVSLTSIYSGAPQTGVDFSDEIIQRLSILVKDKNELLDSEMSNLQQILSPSQIAKFILWIDRNPAAMQMLEALWPHYSRGSTNKE